MTLVDTSVWIAMLRKSRPLDLETTVDFPEIVTCLPIIQELLQGIRDEHSFRLFRNALLSLPILETPLDEQVFCEAADLFRAARRAGQTIRSSTDCLIAACAIRHDALLLHRDRDFKALAAISPLREHSLAP
ncbi:MAG: PIN domain-containing protein [Deltaproteobacteria bacterium]